MVANTFEETEKTNDFAQCTDLKHAYIREHTQQMIERGYKKTFVLEVCRSITLLCANDMEDLMLENVDIKTTTKNSKDKKKRRNTINKPKAIMGRNGGNYRLISGYLKDQQEHSYEEKSQAMQ